MNIFSCGKPKLILSVDVEALKTRAKSNHVNRLIYGDIDGEQWGIGRMMDIADNHDIKMSFFLELASFELYGDAMINAGKYIVERGHDLQLHLHPGVFPADFFSKHNIEAVVSCGSFDEAASKVCVDYMLEKYALCTSSKPMAFRGGGYTFGSAILRELKKRGVLLDSSYNATSPNKLEHRSAFFWEDGLFEIPITINKSLSLNFNNASFLPMEDSLDEFKSAAKNVRDFLSHYFADNGDNAIATMVMHSWSFCINSKKHSQFFDVPNPMYVKYFDYLLNELSEAVRFVTMDEIAYEVKDGNSLSQKYPVYKYEDFLDCNLCGAERAKIVPFNADVDRRCSACGSLERHRTLLTVIHMYPFNFSNLEWLHISPNNMEAKLVSRFKPKKRITIDIRPECKTDIIGDIQNMPEVEADSFDIVLATGVLQHVQNDEKAIAEIYRILRDGGKFLLQVEMSGRINTIDKDDPSAWYGQETLEKYGVGIFRAYGIHDLSSKLEVSFIVEAFSEIDKPSGLSCIWYVCTKDMSRHKPFRRENILMRNIDRITEAFVGNMGTAMMKVSRNRIHWMCSKAKGETILDVGCSQGIATIILAREGKHVTGIDVCQESIDYANTSIQSEDKTTRSNVAFINIDFISYAKDSGNKYDCIIMGEILEHLADPHRFIKVAYDYLEEDGTLVVTVPFGINDYHDHKRTYYLVEVYNTVAAHFTVAEVEFLGGWIGLVCTKTDEILISLDKSLFVEAERAFYAHERKLLYQIDTLKNDVEYQKNLAKQLREKSDNTLEKVKTNFASEKDTLLNQFESEKDTLLNQFESEKDTLLNQFESEKDTLLNQFVSEKDSILTQLSAISKQQTETQIKMAEALAKHSVERTELLEKVTQSTNELGSALKLLNVADLELKQLRERISTLQIENSNYRWKVNRITETWYGKFAIRCYRFLNRIRRSFTRSH